MVNLPIFMLAPMLDLVNLPTIIGQALGIGVLGGQMLLCSVILVAVAIPLAVYGRGNILLTAVVLIAVLGFLTVIGWMDTTVLAFLIFVIVVAIAYKISDLLGGRRGGGGE